MTSEINLFLDHLGERDLTKDTLSHYRIALSDFFEWFTQATGQTGAAAWVTPLDMRQYRDTLKEKYKAATVNGKLGCLSAFFDWCVETGRISKNPALNLKWVKLNLLIGGSFVIQFRNDRDVSSIQTGLCF